jgi:hypothetical protein
MGQVTIANDEVGKELKGDGYRQLTEEEEVRGGDIVLYSLDGTANKGQVEHSATLNSDLTSVRSKSGIENLERRAAIVPGPGAAWGNEKSRMTVWTQRVKGN